MLPDDYDGIEEFTTWGSYLAFMDEWKREPKKEDPDRGVILGWIRGYITGVMQVAGELLAPGVLGDPVIPTHVVQMWAAVHGVEVLRGEPFEVVEQELAAVAFFFCRLGVDWTEDPTTDTAEIVETFLMQSVTREPQPEGHESPTGLGGLVVLHGLLMNAAAEGVETEVPMKCVYDFSGKGAPEGAMTVRFVLNEDAFRAYRQRRGNA